MSKYNLEKLIKVEVVEPRQSTYFKYKSGIKFIRKEGIYDVLHYFFGKEIKNHFLKDGKVYEYARCVLYFQDEYTFTYHFETLKEAKLQQLDIENLFKKQMGRSLVEL